MLVPRGARWNHTRLPCSSVIIAPSWPFLIFGEVKTSPAEPPSRPDRTLIEGGRRPGSEWKCCERSGTPPASSAGVCERPFTGADVLNTSAPSLPAPTSGWLERTVTVSAGASDRSSRKLAPCPSEWAQRRPEWLPLWEPTTLIRRRARMATPRKLICDLGFAVVVPAAG